MMNYKIERIVAQMLCYKKEQMNESVQCEDSAS